MATTDTREAAHDIRCRLNAELVDATIGMITGCTVMKAGVQATGKFVLIDANGSITRDEKLAKKKLPVFTDSKTLDTLMAAAGVAGKRVKMREDHDDSVGARAGYVSNFKRITDKDGDRVTSDLHIFRSYRNREVMLETAKETPEEIGLSIDFTPVFEIQGEQALMRVQKLSAVDIVDEGAVTPDGLFLSARVDTRRKSEISQETATQPPEQMAAAPSNEEIMAALGALTKSVSECMAAVSKLAAPPAVPDADKDGMKALKAEQEKLASELKANAEALKAANSSIAQMKKEKALLGFRGTDAEKAALAAAPVEDIEKLNAGKKAYLQLVAERATAEKCSKADAHVWVQRNHSAVYREHLSTLGVYDHARANMKVA